MMQKIMKQNPSMILFMLVNKHVSRIVYFEIFICKNKKNKNKN